MVRTTTAAALLSIVTALLALAARPGPAPARAAPAYDGVLLSGVPHVRQKPDFCGEACAEMWLRHLGHSTDQDAVFDAGGVDPALGRGLVTRELAQALRRLGFDVGRVRTRVVPERAGAELEAAWAALHADLGRGVPSIVCMRTGDGPDATEHFRLVLGYDAGTDEVVYHEPAEDLGAYHRLPRSRLLALWPLKYEADAWTVVRLRLDAAAPAPPPAATTPTAADLAQHVRALRPRLPRGFSVVVEPPFVVVGDEPPDVVRRRAIGTVRWAVERLKRDYFERDPAEVLDVWLFRDSASYERNARRLFGARPTTPYGYYSSPDRALVMNIETGGGTLVHEIVHPFVEANFPQCPAWLNEGLGSLYEQSADRDGHIRGLTNWRLPGLQRALREGEVPSLSRLVHTSDDEFYADPTGTSYAQARYLCYYLQERGLLKTFFHDFSAARRRDPTGWATLQDVLGNPDMRAFRREWERFVLGLRFPPST